MCHVQLNDVAVEVPEGIPIYDMRTDIPWHFEPQSKWADMLERVAAADPDMLKMLELGEDYPAPYPGARSIIRWETYMVRNRSRHMILLIPCLHVHALCSQDCQGCLTGPCCMDF